MLELHQLPSYSNIYMLTLNQQNALKLLYSTFSYVADQTFEFYDVDVFLLALMSFKN